MALEQTKNQLLKQVVEDCLEEFDKSNYPTPEEIESIIIKEQTERIDLRNMIPILDDNGDPVLDKFGEPKMKRRKDAWQIPTELSPSQIASIINKVYDVIRLKSNVNTANPDLDYLAIYEKEGELEGTYTAFESTFRQIARQYNYSLSDKGFKEVYNALMDIVETKEENTNKDLIAVNNGIFDYKKKELLPFDPNIVLLSKSHVDYNPNATNPHITMPDNEVWDLESWFNGLSDDEEIIKLLWQILGAIIRPYVNWDKCAWFYSEEGNNGKGTLCELMRNICGGSSYASIPLNRFSQDSILEQLVNVSSIITDENDVGTYIDQSANLKAVITQDAISINRKYKTAITFKFRGFMVQCVNELPKMKDNSPSMYRRLVIIPFTKSFKDVERKYIKHDYLKRKEVLEYALYKVLNTDYYELDIPDSCINSLEDYKEHNDSLREFWFDVRDELSWDLVPFNYLYDLYVAWKKRNIPEGKAIRRHKFITDLVQILHTTKDDIWYCDDKNAKVYAKNKMQDPQPLSVEYSLVDWMNLAAKSLDVNVRSTISKDKIKENYRGIQRITNKN